MDLYLFVIHTFTVYISCIVSAHTCISACVFMGVGSRRRAYVFYNSLCTHAHVCVSNATGSSGAASSGFSSAFHSSSSTSTRPLRRHHRRPEVVLCARAVARFRRQQTARQKWRPHRYRMARTKMAILAQMARTGMVLPALMARVWSMVTLPLLQTTMTRRHMEQLWTSVTSLSTRPLSKTFMSY